MYQVNTLYKPFIFLIDLIGYLLFGWLKLRRLKDPKKILCIRIDHIGDVLLSTPAFRALKKRFPKARVDVLVRSFSKEILDGNKNVGRVIAFDSPWLGIHGKKTGWKETNNVIKSLKKEKYDLVIDFHADPRNIILAFLVGKYRIGYGIRGFGFLLNKVVSYKRKVQHQIQYNLDLVRALRANASAEMDFFIPQSAKKRAKSLLKPAGRTKLVGITPAAGKRMNKYWFNERWAAVADALVEQYDVKIVLTGGKSDKEDIREIFSSMKNKKSVIDISGKTSLKELGAVIAQCKLFISPDTGPSHFARALNVPLLALFGPEDPRRWGYNTAKFRHTWKKRTRDITVRDVLVGVAKIGVL